MAQGYDAASAKDEMPKEQARCSAEDERDIQEGKASNLPEDAHKAEDEPEEDPAKPAFKKKKDKKKSDSEIEQLKTELEAQKDLNLRLRAEYDNYRKRSMTEKAAVYNNAVADAIAAILPVADNMDRALNQQNASAEDIKKGLQMISNQFESSFEQLNIKIIGKKGDVFDPNLHNAVSHIEDDSVEDGVITEVMQKGYRIGDKVIRHAMVQVAN